MTKGTRPLKRKTSHSIIERRRREKINEGLIHLQDTVPACQLELKEFIECKVSNNKKNLKKDEDGIKIHIEEMIKEKSASEMVLEKLCIISHTVDYVHELQDKVDAYRRWCRCSPPLPDAPFTRNHDQVHTTPELVSVASTSERGDSSNCEGCATIRRAKRHWGSNHPLQLNRVATNSIAKEDKVESKVQRRSQRQVEASFSQNINNLINPPEDESSDLELDDWHQSANGIFAPNVYSHGNHLTSRKRRATLESFDPPSIHHPTSHDNARLGLLAQISAETERVKYSSRPF